MAVALTIAVAVAVALLVVIPEGDLLLFFHSQNISIIYRPKIAGQAPSHLRNNRLWTLGIKHGAQTSLGLSAGL
jgi:hypothetical protein